MEDKKK